MEQRSSIGLRHVLVPFKALQLSSNIQSPQNSQFLLALYDSGGPLKISKSKGLGIAMRLP